MKNLFKISIFTLLSFAVLSCEKSEKENPKQVNVSTEKNSDLEQDALTMENSKGESIDVIYFAKGDKVAVKIRLNDKEIELLPQGTTSSGNPFFSNDEYTWEM